MSFDAVDDAEIVPHFGREVLQIVEVIPIQPVSRIVQTRRERVRGFP